MIGKLKPIRRIIFLTGLSFLIGACSVVAETPGDRVPELMASVRPAFVFIGGGSGAVISADGYLVSNAHVVRDEKHFTVRLGNGRSYEARVVGLNREGDLALLKISGANNLAHLPLGDSDSVSVGAHCMAVGNPLALGMVDQRPTFTIGVISAKHLYRGIYNDALVTDAPVNPGNSGGPLVNMKGELIGVNGQIETRWGLRANTGIGLAVPANQIKRWLPHLKKAEGKNVPRGHLPGIQWAAPRAENVPGAPVKNVARGSRAAAMGLQAGDIIIAAAGQDVWNVARFRSILGGYPAGSAISLRVRRNETTRQLEVKLQRPPKAGFKLGVAEKDKRRIAVEEITDGSAADKADLREGDVVLAVGERKLTGPPNHQIVTAALAIRQQVVMGREVELKIRRLKNGDTVEKTVRFFPGGN